MYVLYVNGKVDLGFDIGKQYDLGSGYIALKNKRKPVCILCRFLSKDEETYCRKTHYLIDDRDEKKEKRKVVILNELDDFEQADKVIESYRKAYDTFPG